MATINYALGAGVRLDAIPIFGQPVRILASRSLLQTGAQHSNEGGGIRSSSGGARYKAALPGDSNTVIWLLSGHPANPPVPITYGVRVLAP
jgi:hypothetical protein